MTNSIIMVLLILGTPVAQSNVTIEECVMMQNVYASHMTSVTVDCWEPCDCEEEGDSNGEV